MSYNNVDSFLEKISAMKPVTKKQNFEKKRQIEKVFCNFKGNFGKYQLLPMNSTISDFPYVSLSGTREIRMPRKNMAADGSENVYNAWIRLLPKSAYTIKDPSSGREVSSLTAADEALLDQAYNVWEQLYTELDVKNNATDPTVRDLIRRKNYTIFCAFTPNYWSEGDTRNPARQMFSGLFVITAKGFMDILSENIESTNITEGMTNTNWIADVCNRDLTGRKAFMMMSIGASSNGKGFNISITHKLDAGAYLSNVTIPEEDAKLMENPVEAFLGWQARNEDPDVPSSERKLFNKSLIQEAVDYMTDQLTKIRIAKQTGSSIADAVKATNEMVLKNQKPTNSMGRATNDPVLAGMSGSAQGGYGNNAVPNNPGSVIGRNDNPYSTPPAAHFDTVTGSPIGSGDTNNLPF